MTVVLGLLKNLNNFLIVVFCFFYTCFLVPQSARFLIGYILFHATIYQVLTWESSAIFRANSISRHLRAEDNLIGHEIKGHSPSLNVWPRRN